MSLICHLTKLQAADDNGSMTEELHMPQSVAQPEAPESVAPIAQAPSRLPNWMDSTTAKVGEVVLAIAATVVTARHAIGNGYFKSMNKAGAFTDLQTKRDEAIKVVLDKAKEGVPVDVLG